MNLQERSLLQEQPAADTSTLLWQSGSRNKFRSCNNYRFF